MTYPYDADLWDFYNEALQRFQDDQRGEREPGWWNASSLGKCPHSLIRKQLGDPGANGEISAKSRRAFVIGDAIHDLKKLVAGRMGLLVYPEEGKEFYLRDEDLRLSGYVDRLMVWPPQPMDAIPAEIAAEWSEEWVEFVAALREDVHAKFSKTEPGYYILEDKSIKASSMTYAPLWVDGGPGEPKPEHLLQVGSYALIADRHPEQLPGPIAGAKITYTGKDSGGVLDFDVDMAAAADAALQRVALLSAEFSKDSTDDITCECEGWQVFYCAHRDIIEETKGPKGGRRIHGVCCNGQAEYERAWKAGDEELF